MESLLKGKKFFTFEKWLACFTGILLVMFAVFSCNNMLVKDGGSLIIALPGARAATASRFTIELTGTNGTPKSQTLEGGTTAQFDDLAPDTYSIVVKGMDASGAVVFYGTSSATVKAGERKSADVNLLAIIHSLEELKSAVTADCSLYIGSSFEVTEPIEIKQNVNIMAMADVTLTSSNKQIFKIYEGGKLSLAGESKILTLQTSGSNNILFDGGELILEDNVTITGDYNYGCVAFGNNPAGVGTFIMNGGAVIGEGSSSKGIYIYNTGTFIMNGGTISNHASGIFLQYSANFTMTGGRISDNTSSGISFSNNDPICTISDSAVIDSINLTSEAQVIIGGVLTGSTPVATIKMTGYGTRVGKLPVLKDNDGGRLVSTEYKKFAVGDETYTIDASGNLQKVEAQ